MFFFLNSVLKFWDMLWVQMRDLESLKIWIACGLFPSSWILLAQAWITDVLSYSDFGLLFWLLMMMVLTKLSWFHVWCDSVCVCLWLCYEEEGMVLNPMEWSIWKVIGYMHIPWKLLENRKGYKSQSIWKDTTGAEVMMKECECLLWCCLENAHVIFVPLPFPLRKVECVIIFFLFVHFTFNHNYV